MSYLLSSARVQMVGWKFFHQVAMEPAQLIILHPIINRLMLHKRSKGFRPGPSDHILVYLMSMQVGQEMEGRELEGTRRPYMCFHYSFSFCKIICKVEIGCRLLFFFFFLSLIEWFHTISYTFIENFFLLLQFFFFWQLTVINNRICWGSQIMWKNLDVSRFNQLWGFEFPTHNWPFTLLSPNFKMDPSSSHLIEVAL